MALPSDALAPGVAEALRRSAELMPATGKGIPEMRAAYEAERAWWNEPVIDLASVTDEVLDLDDRSVGIRVYRPSNAAPLPALVYLHGGGFVVGSLDSYDRIMRQLCRRSGAVVVGVDYPLAPEHPHPAAVATVELAVISLADRPDEHGIDPARISIGGDSAGAYLALAAALRLRRHRPSIVKFLLLYYGLYGFRESPSRLRFADPGYGLTPAELRFYEACYLGPEASPQADAIDLLTSDLSALPPAFVAAAALDPLLDDSLALSEALTRSGGSADLRIYAGVLHGFLHWSRLVPTAAQALEDGACALEDVLFKPLP